jgi:dephospho-CoA kinase
MVLGLTGGIGCGKSAALAVFARLGFHVVDADQLARTVLARPDIAHQLVARWGGAALGADGLPDRAWIGRKVFGTPAELAFLEALVHPEVARLRHAAVADASKHHVVEIPLLFEKGLAAEYDYVVCVACSDEVRLSRLEARGLTRQDAQARINSQMPLVHKVMKSNHVLWNDGDLPALAAQVTRLVARLTAAEKSII